MAIGKIRRLQGSYWIGISNSFAMDAWVIGFVFIYVILYKETWWAAKHRWSVKQGKS